MDADHRPTCDPSRVQALTQSLQLTRDLLAEMESQPGSEMLRANVGTVRAFQALLEGMLADTSETDGASQVPRS